MHHISLWANYMSLFFGYHFKKSVSTTHWRFDAVVSGFISLKLYIPPIKLSVTWLHRHTPSGESEENGVSCPRIQYSATSSVLQLSKPLRGLQVIGRYRLPPPDEGRSDILWEGGKDNCESLVWVYFLLCCLFCMFKLRYLLHDVPPQTFIRPPMMAAFHIVVLLWTGG